MRAAHLLPSHVCCNTVAFIINWVWKSNRNKFFYLFLPTIISFLNKYFARARALSLLTIKLSSMLVCGPLCFQWSLTDYGLMFNWHIYKYLHKSIVDNHLHERRSANSCTKYFAWVWVAVQVVVFKNTFQQILVHVCVDYVRWNDDGYFALFSFKLNRLAACDLRN